MKNFEYSLHCPCCGRYINSSESVYYVNDEWVCEDCMLDVLEEDEEPDFDMRSAIDLAEEPYWSAVDYRIDDLKEFF